MIIGIVGAGTMGTGIAQVAAQAGHAVMLNDERGSALSRAQTKLQSVMQRLVDKGKLRSPEAHAIQKRITFTNKLQDLARCGVVIEAVVETLEIKQAIIRALDSIVSPETILASNTSSLLITAIASASAFPERVVGLHFFNPAPLLTLVEVVQGMRTLPSVCTAVSELVSLWGKSPVLVQDTPGFIVNRVARPFYGEALILVEEGMADIASIDLAMREQGGFRMGPFELMDLIGVDVNLQVTRSVFELMHYDPRYRPSLLQERMVAAGRLGRKTSLGFYDYREGAHNPEPTRDAGVGIAIVQRIVAMLINEAVELCRLRIATPTDIDRAMTLGVNYPKGLLVWADEWGCAAILERLEVLHDTYVDARYRPSPLLRTMAAENRRFYD